MFWNTACVDLQTRTNTICVAFYPCLIPLSSECGARQVIHPKAQPQSMFPSKSPLHFRPNPAAAYIERGHPVRYCRSRRTVRPSHRSIFSFLIALSAAPSYFSIFIAGGVIFIGEIYPAPGLVLCRVRSRGSSTCRVILARHTPRRVKQKRTAVSYTHLTLPTIYSV